MKLFLSKYVNKRGELNDEEYLQNRDVDDLESLAFGTMLILNKSGHLLVTVTEVCVCEGEGC